MSVSLPNEALARARLYAILDLDYVAPARVTQIAEQLLRGGADILQLRGKNQAVEKLAELAATVHPLTSRAGVPLVMNDHPEILQDVLVEGLHLGQDDLPIAAAREIVRRDCWVGKSTHSLAQARAAMEEGADYIGFGPLFATPTKPDYQPIGLEEIGRVHQLVKRPIFCIGGIKLKNLAQVLAAGAGRVVIVSGLLQAQDIVAATQQAKRFLLEKQTPEIRN